MFTIFGPLWRRIVWPITLKPAVFIPVRTGRNIINEVGFPMLVHMMLEASGLRVLVVGGGAVAARKAGQLLAGGAEITLLSPGRQEAAWQEIAENCRWLPQPYDEEFAVSGYDLVIAATNQPELNRQLAERCRKSGLLCNCASMPKLGRVVLPGVVQGKSFSLAVASGGRLPFLTKQLKAELKQFLAVYEQKYDAQTIELLTELRRRIIAELDGQPQQKKMLLHRLAILAGQPDKLKAILQDFGLKQSGGYNGNISAIIDWLQGEPAGAGADAAGGGAD